MYNKSIRSVMKKAFIVFIAAVATIACTKESSIQDKNLTPEGGLLSIEATVSPFVDDATKASISVNGSGAVTGTFSWSEGDQIAFPVTGSPAYVALTYNPENGKFEGKANDGQAVDNTRQIVYPASRVIGGTYSTDFASIAEAKAGFKMTASVPASLSEKITMTHESALVHVQFTNVPDFANELVVSDGSSNVATIPASEGTVDFYVPITPAGSKTYSFSIKEGSNVIKSVSKTISLTAGKYYNTPTIAIRYIRVGVISYIYEGWLGFTTGWKVHYWGESTGDAAAIPLGTTEKKSVGASYWSNAAQTFNMFYAVIPNGSTGFKVWHDNDNWFGGDASSSNTKAYVFEYDSNKLAYYEQLSIQNNLAVSSI